MRSSCGCLRRSYRLAGWFVLAASGPGQLGSVLAFWGRRTGRDPGGSVLVGNAAAADASAGRTVHRRADLARSAAAAAPTPAFAQQDRRASGPASAAGGESELGDRANERPSPGQEVMPPADPPSPPETVVRRPERGKVLTRLTPEQMYGAYRDIQLDYQRRAFASPAPAGGGGGGRRRRRADEHRWKVLNERDGVRVSLLQHPDDPHCPYVRMSGVIDAPVQECWNFLMVDRWDESMPKMDPFYEGVTVIGEYSHPQSGVHMTLCRKRTKRILAFGKRDLVFLSVVDTPLDDGTWVSGSVSVVTPHVPRQPGYTRAFQDSIAFYQPLDNNTRTNLTIVCRIDLNDSGNDGAGGWIPMWLYVKTIGVTAVESVLRMRRAIEGQIQKQEKWERKQERPPPGEQ